MGTSSGSPFSTTRLRHLVAMGLKMLEERRDEINDLNVYPVPDGDTGTNMALTIRSVLEELRSVPDDASAQDLATSVGRAALMGARGNSGVILSQMVRGAMEVMAEDRDFDDEVIAAAFGRATDAAYRAVRRPVEGTMLTVLRDMKDEAESGAAHGDHRHMLEQILRAGWESVRRTPEQLKVLAEAGVVDAGGFGLLVFIEGMMAGAEGDDIVDIIDLDLLSGRPEHPVVSEPEEVGEFTYCTSFVLMDGAIDPAEFEAAITDLGDSLLVVGDRARLKVHIHTDDPGRILGLATERGTLTGIAIDNMRLQTAERSERLRIAGANADQGEARATDVVAVVAGDGNKQLFASLGARRIVEGGQSMNPSAEELLAAVESAVASEVVVLPNNKNVILAAEQVAGMTDKVVHVVPTGSIQAGLAAMVLYDPHVSGEDNAEGMAEVLGDVHTAEVTVAVRDSQLNGLDIVEGTFIGLVDGEVVATEAELADIVRQVAARLVNGETEVLTVLLGADEEFDPGVGVGAVEMLRERYPEVEIEVHRGGQPLYPLLLAAE